MATRPAAAPSAWPAWRRIHPCPERRAARSRPWKAEAAVFGFFVCKMSDKTEEKITQQEITEQDTVSAPEIKDTAESNTDKAELNNAVVEALKSVYDPEIPVDIYELGLIYVIEYLDLTPHAVKVRVDMTLTAPGCPVAGSMPEWVANAVNTIPVIEECLVDLVWEPFWTPEKMSLRAKLELNMF